MRSASFERGGADTGGGVGGATSGTACALGLLVLFFLLSSFLIISNIAFSRRPNLGSSTTGWGLVSFLTFFELLFVKTNSSSGSSSLPLSSSSSSLCVSFSFFILASRPLRRFSRRASCCFLVIPFLPFRVLGGFFSMISSDGSWTSVIYTLRCDNLFR